MSTSLEMPFYIVMKEIENIKLSTANWSVAILSILGASIFGFLFSIPDKQSVSLFFTVSYKLLLSSVFIPLCILLLASLFAQVDKEHTIKKKHFKKSILITSGVLAWKLTTSYYS